MRNEQDATNPPSGPPPDRRRGFAPGRLRLAAVALIGALVVLGIVLAETLDVFGGEPAGDAPGTSGMATEDGRPIDLLEGRQPHPAEPAGGTPAATDTGSDY